jgi:LEA14-like dessication related protein
MAAKKRDSSSGSKPNPGRIIRLVIFFLIIWLVFNLFAMSMVKIDSSGQGLFNIFSNMSAQPSWVRTEIRGHIRLINPSLLPVYATGVAYSVDYGGLHVGNGTTESFFMWPMSEKDVSADFELNNANAVRAILSGFANIFNPGSIQTEIKYEIMLGPFRIPIERKIEQTSV